MSKFYIAKSINLLREFCNFTGTKIHKYELEMFPDELTKEWENEFNKFIQSNDDNYYTTNMLILNYVGLENIYIIIDYNKSISATSISKIINDLDFLNIGEVFLNYNIEYMLKN